MYGNQPAIWNNNLKNPDRLRFIINSFTRMRFCNQQGALELKTKMPPNKTNHDLIPWFELPNRVPIKNNLIFGHWASLEGKVTLNNLFALDTGCVWGGKLTALRLEDKKIFSVKSRQKPALF